MRRLGVLLVVAVAMVGAAYVLREPRVPPAQAAPLHALCGSERWLIKTLSDPDRTKVDLTRRYRTVKQLNGIPRPAQRPSNGRAAGELSVYRVVATLTTSINEDDGDIHLVLTGDDGSTLIAEAPEPACSVIARDRAAINRARLAAQDATVGTKYVAIGVAFFDFAHRQTGHATNYIELHPLLSLKPL